MPKSLDPAYPRVKKENGASGQSESRRLFHNRLKDVCTANVPKKSHIFILSSGSTSQMLHVNPEARLEKLIKWGEGTRSCSRLPQCGLAPVAVCHAALLNGLVHYRFFSQARHFRRRVMRFTICLCVSLKDGREQPCGKGNKFSPTTGSKTLCVKMRWSCPTQANNMYFQVSL